MIFVQNFGRCKGKIYFFMNSNISGKHMNLYSKTSLTALTFDLPSGASAECVMCEMKYKVIITSLAFWYPLPLHLLKIAAVFFSFLAERPFIDHTRVGVFGEVRLSRPEYTCDRYSNCSGCPVKTLISVSSSSSELIPQKRGNEILQRKHGENVLCHH